MYSLDFKAALFYGVFFYIFLPLFFSLAGLYSGSKLVDLLQMTKLSSSPPFAES